MDSRSYLKRYGWEEGEALKKGGIKRPILVKHKKDKKGIGHVVSGSADAWWERLFDGQLKSLDVNHDKKDGISFKQDKIIATSISRQDSPLYRMFIRGEILQGTTGKVNFLNCNPAANDDEVKKEAMQKDLNKLKTSFSSSESSDILTDIIPRDKKPDKKKKTKTSDRRDKIEKKNKKRDDGEKKSSKKRKERLTSKDLIIKAKSEEEADEKSHWDSKKRKSAKSDKSTAHKRHKRVQENTR